jgi:hypothetical protein
MALTDEQLREEDTRAFRNELLALLERIAIALESMEVVDIEDASS